MQNTFIGSDAVLSVDLRLSGAHEGHMRGEVSFRSDGAEGSIETEVDGRRVDGPPRGACPSAEPPVLRVRAGRSRLAAGRRSTIRVAVSAVPYDPSLPVRASAVTLAGRTALTDEHGVARIVVRPRAGRHLIRLRARAAGFRGASRALRVAGGGRGDRPRLTG